MSVTLPHCVADPIQKIPGGFIANPHSTAQMDSRDPPFVGGAQIDCPESGRKGQMSTVHNSSGSNGGLVPARTALVSVPVTDRVKFHTTTFRAYEPIREPEPEQFRSASLLGVITMAKFLIANC